MKIAIVKTSALGDIIHASFVPSLLKKHLPNVQIDWIITQDLAEILENHPHIDNIIVLPYSSQASPWTTMKGLWQFSWLKHPHYDYIFDLQSLIKSAFISYLLPGKRVGFSPRGCREQLASLSYNCRHDIAYSTSIFERNLFLFTQQLQKDIPPTYKEPDTNKHLHFTKKAAKHIQKYLQPNKKHILFIPGASTMKKVYSPARYAKVIDNLCAHKYHFSIAWGNAKEQHLATQIHSQCQTNKPDILNKRLSFDHLKALIDCSDLVIGSDTGPVHLAWALKTPSIVLFATSNPASAERNHLTTTINKAISATSMHTISTASILKQIKSLLDKK